MAENKGNLIKNSKVVKEPNYLNTLYGFLYKRKKVRSILNDQRVQNFLSLGYRNKMIEDVLEDVATNSNVLQIGCTFGNQISKTAEKIGKYGSYTISDISAEQLNFCHEQNKNQKINYLLHDARKAFNEKFDTVICLMLLHELPPISRYKVINNALEAVKKDGKVIFIDYDNPSKFNLLRIILKPFNRLFFPLTESLQLTGIQAYAQKSTHFLWYKKNYGAKMFQKIVAVRRISEDKKPQVKPSFY